MKVYYKLKLKYSKYKKKLSNSSQTTKLLFFEKTVST